MVDTVNFNDETTNFQIPWLTRVHGPAYDRPSTYSEDQRFTARDLNTQHFFTAQRGSSSDDWANPARERNGPLAKAVIIANQKSAHSVLVAGPLANAVRGELNVETAETVDDMLPTDRKVFLVGYNKTLSRNLTARLRDRGCEVVTLVGGHPYSNAVQAARIIDRHRPPGIKRRIVLASAKAIPDALAASAAAGSSKGAVLLTDGTRMPKVTKEYIASHRPSNVYAVGRAASRAAPGLPDNRTIAGANRYSTAAKVAKRFFPEPAFAVFASGSDYVDALLAGAYGGHEKAPLPLVRRDSVPPAVADYIGAHRAGLRDSVLVGGRSRISTATFDALMRRLTPR